MSQVIRIVLAEDFAPFRRLLVKLLGEQPDMEIVGEANDGKEAVEMAKQLSPRVVLMDYSMPGLNGPEATQLILAECPDVRVLALSMHDDPELVDTMLTAGAVGYVSKFDDWPAITEAVRQAAG